MFSWPCVNSTASLHLFPQYRYTFQKFKNVIAKPYMAYLPFYKLFAFFEFLY